MARSCLYDLVHGVVRSDVDPFADNKGLLMSSMGMMQSGGSVGSVENGLITSEHEDVVDESTGKTTADWAEDGSPEPVLRSVIEEDVFRVTNHGKSNSGAKITSRIQCISSLHTERSTFSKNEDEEYEGDETSRWWSV